MAATKDRFGAPRGADAADLHMRQAQPTGSGRDDRAVDADRSDALVNCAREPLSGQDQALQDSGCARGGQEQTEMLPGLEAY